MAVTLKPRDFKINAIEEVATPLPIPDITPPDTKINFVFKVCFLQFVGNKILYSKFACSFMSQIKLCIHKKSSLNRGAMAWVSFDYAQDFQPARIISKKQISC